MKRATPCMLLEFETSHIMLGRVILILLVGVCSTKELVLRPNDPNFVVGEDLKLRCTLSSSSSYTVDEVAFESETLVHGVRHWQPVHLKFTRKANNTLHLIIPNITLEYDRATFSCVIKTRREYIDSQIVRVGYRPEKPEIVSAIVYNWEDFIFTWKTGRVDYSYETHFDAWFKIRRPNEEFRSCRSCVGLTKECPYQNDAASTCTIPDAHQLVHPHGFMSIKVNSSNPVGRSSSDDNVTLDLFLIVKPAPINELRILRNGTRPIVLQFSAPQNKWNDLKIYEDLLYNIMVSCDNGRYVSKNEIKARKGNVSWSMPNLPFFTMCTVSVNCKPFYIKKSNGYWSEPVQLTFRSQEGVPLAVPEICSSCFFINTKHSGYRDVVLYFKVLDQSVARGIVCQYKACIYGNSTQTPHDITRCSSMSVSDEETEDCKWNVSSVLVHLPSNGEYLLAVVAATSAGFNRNLSVDAGVTIPDTMFFPAGPNNITAIIQNDLSVEVHWDAVLKATSYDVAWCEDRTADYLCRKFERIKVDSSHTNWRIPSINPSIGGLNYLIFGVAAQFETVSSGIIWSDYTYNTVSSVLPPDVIHIGTTETTVALSIRKPSYQHSKAFVYGFAIYYSNSELPGAKSERLVIADRELLDGQYTVNGLEPGTKYAFTVHCLSVGNAQYRNSTVISVRTSHLIWSKGMIAGVSVACFIGLVLVIAGLYTIIRFYRKCTEGCAKYWQGMPILVPDTDDRKVINECDHESQSPLLFPSDETKSISTRHPADGEEEYTDEARTETKDGESIEMSKTYDVDETPLDQSASKWGSVDETSLDQCVSGEGSYEYAKCMQKYEQFSISSSAPANPAALPSNLDVNSSIEDEAVENESLLASEVDQGSDNVELDSYSKARCRQNYAVCRSSSRPHTPEPAPSRRSSGDGFAPTSICTPQRDTATLSTTPLTLGTDQNNDECYSQAVLHGNPALVESNINNIVDASSDTPLTLGTDQYNDECYSQAVLLSNPALVESNINNIVDASSDTPLTLGTDQNNDECYSQAVLLSNPALAESNINNIADASSDVNISDQSSDDLDKDNDDNEAQMYS